MPTDPSKNMTPDIYDLATYVNEIKKEFTDDVSDDTLMVGIYGMLGELFSNMAQNNIVMASEFANESIPTRAKFEKNIISHALNLNIQTLNATPAKMDVFLTFIEDEIIDFIGGDYGTFTFDCDNKIYFGDYEFHTDYDIEIRRVKLANGDYTYTAMYNMTGEGVYENPISDIDNPYLTPPVVMKIDGTRYLFTACTIRQVEKKQVYKKILVDNTIASKTTNFEFEGQLAAFTVDVTNDASSSVVHLVPVYEGLVNSNSLYQYIWFTYLDQNNIRVKFDKNSYTPRVNSDVTINVMTTSGTSGNFKWASTEYPVFSFESERLGYSNITTEIRPINNQSMYGTDKKTIEELRRIIAIEALARGSITNNKDLQNYFNAVDSDNSKMYFYKKRDNCLERLYYSYIVMKDEKSNIVPTNTINLIVNPSDLKREDISSRLVLERGKMIKLNGDGTGTICSSDEVVDYDKNFYYMIPYNFAISTDPMYGMYYLTIMNVNKNLEFSYINDACQYQYIATYITMERKLTENPDLYKIRISLEQNLTDDSSMMPINPETKELDMEKLCVKVYMTLYNDDGIYRWLEGSVVSFDEHLKILNYEFTIASKDYINSENEIRVEGVNQIGSAPGSSLSYGYLPSNVKAMIHVVTKQPTYSTNKIYDDLTGNTSIDLSTQIPFDGMEDWTVTNSYNVINGLDFFYNYTEIVYSTINVIKEYDDEGNYNGKYHYMVMGVPMIKYNYFKDESMVNYFCSELIRRKYYIDEALHYIEDSFGMNFKFFNTYGPSKRFTLDNGVQYLDRVNITLKFRVALMPNYDENIIQYMTDDIKGFVESINEISSLHIPNLITTITTKYRDSLTFFEFLGFNGYGPGQQHLFAMPMPDDVETPELININTKDDQSPDIEIAIV